MLHGASAIETRDLTKRFRPGAWPGHRGVAITAVDGVDLTVRPGEIYGLLGHNGAGKSTLVRLLCGLVAPDGGSGQVAGVEVSRTALLRRAVGLAAGGERGLYPRLSARQQLAFFAGLRGLTGQERDLRINEVLSLVGLADAAGRPVQTYSTGMRQRLALATALLHRPRVLLLDEPTRSLDPLARAELHGLLREDLAPAGVTILLVTYDLAEAESLCDRLALMAHGRIVADGAPAELVTAGRGGLADAYRALLEER